jgi:hypothetical protein
MRRFRSLMAAIVLVGVAGYPAPGAQAAYFIGPASPPPVMCSTTATTLSGWVSNVNTAAPGTVQCLANGTYTGPANINRMAAGMVTAASVSGYGAVITGGIDHQGGSVTYQGLDIENSGGGVNRNDCFQEEPGITAAVTLQYVKVQHCYRNGIVVRRPPACTPSPCPPPSSGYSNNFTLDNSFVTDVGKNDKLGTAVIVRTPSAGTMTPSGPAASKRSSAGSAEFTNSDISTGPNDAFDGWGDGITVRRNLIHGFTAAVGNHTDAFQTWEYTNDDGAEGPPLTNFTFEGNRVYSFAGSDAHVFMAEGAGHSGLTFRWNEYFDVGSASHGIILGKTGTGDVLDASVLNNDFVNVGQVEFNNASTGTLENNIFRSCSEASNGTWVISAGASVTVSNNTGDGNANCTATGANAANRGPQFVSEGTSGTRDLHLQSGSPEHDAGTGATGGLDIDGMATPFGTINRGSDED